MRAVLERFGDGAFDALCRGFVAAMGGSIAAANRADRRGTVFTVTLPAVPVAVVPALVPGAPAGPASGPASAPTQPRLAI